MLCAASILGSSINAMSSAQQATGASVIPNNVADHGCSTELWLGQHKKDRCCLAFQDSDGAKGIKRTEVVEVLFVAPLFHCSAKV